MPVCLRSQPSCYVSLKFAGYSNLLNGDIMKNVKFEALSARCAKPWALRAHRASFLRYTYLIDSYWRIGTESMMYGVA